MLEIWLENREKMNTYTISFPSTFCLRYAYSNYEKRRRFWGVSRMPIDQECKHCGKTFRNKGYQYCCKDCESMDEKWNYIEIWKCYNKQRKLIGASHCLNSVVPQKMLINKKITPKKRV